MKLIKLLISCFLFTISVNPLFGAPVINSVSPSNGPTIGGTVVTITGSGFTSATAVNFGFRPATTFNVITDNTISATAPPGTSGTVDIIITNGSETSALTPLDFYTYTEPSWKGILSEINPDAIVLFATGTNTIDRVIPLPNDSLAAVITPDGTTIYAANQSQASVTVIDAATNTIINTIPTPTSGTGAFDIIVSPDGKKVYVSNFDSGYITVIETTTNTVEAYIPVEINLGPLSITPDGKTVYVSDFFFSNVTPIDTATNTVGTSIATGTSPGMISITPDGSKAYVTNLGSDTISVIDIATTNTVVETISLPLGSSGPYGSSIIPNGKTMYVANINTSNITVIDIATNSVTDTIPFSLSPNPFWVVTTPDSKTVYVINETDVTPIDVATNTAGPSFGQVAGFLQDIVMSPDQAPVASFSVNVQPVQSPTIFDASASISPIGTIASYFWDFGDGTSLTTNTPIVAHTYTSTGFVNVVLTVTNSAGTSTSKVFSSRFMSNNGGPTAISSQTINIPPIIPLPPSPPKNVRGFQRSCQFPTQTDLINVIKWSPPSTIVLPVAYRIYRNAALTNLIATIPARGKLIYEDHNRKKKKRYTYYIVSVSATRAISLPVSVTIKPKK